MPLSAPGSSCSLALPETRMAARPQRRAGRMRIRVVDYPSCPWVLFWGAKGAGLIV